MKRTLLLVFVLSLFVFSVTALKVTIPQTDFDRGVDVNISVNCAAGDSVVRVLNPGSELVYVDQGKGQFSSIYNTNFDSSKGNYSIQVSCQDDDSKSINFCVESPHCLGNRIQDNPDNPDRSNGGGNPGRTCRSVWQCDSYWSQCDSNMTQLRNCVDTTNCALPKLENRTCAPCQEAWACSSWSPCEGGMERRTCLDDKDCGTATYKPVQERPCGVDIGGYEPDRYTTQVPPPTQAAPSRLQYPAVQKVQTPIPTTSFWDEWGFLILALFAVLLLVGIILYLLHMRHNKHPAYNSDELKVWMLKEREAGASDGDIRQILMEQTGWTKEDVDLAFEELAKGQGATTDGPVALASPTDGVEKDKK